MYLDNYHLLANTTPARHGKEQKRKFIYTENRSSCRVGYSWNWALERVLLVSQSESVVGGTELSLPCPAPFVPNSSSSNNKNLCSTIQPYDFPYSEQLLTVDAC